MTNGSEYREMAAANTELFAEIKGALKVGEDYEIEIEIPTSAGKATTTYQKIKQVCRLLAKYQRYALFSYPGRGGYEFRATKLYQDIRL